VRTCVYRVHIIIAIALNRLIFAISVEQRVDKGIFWIRHASIVTRKNDKAQSLNNIQVLSFSLQDED
jgi:hypothetical protein